MALPIHGRGTVLGLGKEVTPGTAVSRTRWVFVNSTNLTLTARNRALRGMLAHKSSAFANEEYVVDEQVGGMITAPMMYAGLGLLFEAALGNVSGSSSPFTFSADSTLPSLTVEQIYGDSGRSEVFAGCKVNGLTIKASPGAEVLIDVDFIAMSKAADDTAGSPSMTSTTFVEFFQVSATWGGAAISSGEIKDLSLAITNGLARRDSLGRLGTAEPTINSQRRAVTTLSIEKGAFTARAAEILDTAADLVITLSDGTSSYVITIPSSRLKVADPIGGSFGAINETITIESLGNPSIVFTSAGATYDA